MATWNYLHRIEYRRELSKTQRVHEYTEVVEDMGWCFSHRKEHQQRWLAYYTKACAEDYFERVMAKAGTWIVTVYRQYDDRRDLVCSVRMTWPGPGRSAAPS